MVLTISTYKPYWLSWVVIFYEANFECHDILMLGKSSIKWRQRPDMTIAIDLDVKHQFKQTKIKLVNRSGLSLPRKSGLTACPGKLVPAIHMYKPFVAHLMVIFGALVGCHHISILGKSPIKWRQRTYMTIVVDCDVKHRFKQANIYIKAIAIDQELVTARFQ